MKKVLLAMVAVAIGFSAYGQSQNTGEPTVPGVKGYIPSPVKLQNTHTPSTQKLNKKVDTDAWYNWMDAAAGSQIVTFTGYNNTTLFPDSTVKQIYGDGSGGTILGYVGLHAIGMVFDPKSQYFDNINFPPSLGRYTKYTVDSVATFYRYYRPIDTAEDKVLFQFYTSKIGGGIQQGSIATTPPDPTAWVAYNPISNKGAGAEAEYTVNLTNDDTVNTTTGSFGTMVVPTNGIEVPANGLFAFTMIFQPGYDYELGDTIDDRWEPAPAKKLNHFKVAMYHDQNKNPHESYNHGLRVTTGIRYAKTGENWSGRFIPGDAWVNYNEYLYSSFYVRAKNISAYDAFENYAMGDLYPNPAQNVANIDFSLGNTEQVNIFVTDIAGKKVTDVVNGQYTSGVHKVSFSTADMQPGIYFYTITAGEYTQTSKFVVSR